MANIFVSHATEDEAVAMELVDALERHGYTTWCYRRNKITGPSFTEQILKALDECGFVLAIISRDAFLSTGVDMELQEAHRLGKRIMPLLCGMSHDDFGNEKPDWHMLTRSATSICMPEQGLSDILDEILRGARWLLSGHAPGISGHAPGSVARWPFVRDFVDVSCQYISSEEAVWDVRIRMTALLDEGVARFHHAATASDATKGRGLDPSDIDFRVLTKPEAVSATWRVLTAAKKRIEWAVDLTPPLTAGQQMEYRYVRRGGHARWFTKEDARTQAQEQGAWFSDPVSYVAFYVNNPTERLRWKVSFPEGYMPRPLPPRVTTRAKGLVDFETEWLDETKRWLWSPETRTISLDVPSPLSQCHYWIVWDPPKKSDIAPHVLVETGK